MTNILETTKYAENMERRSMFLESTEHADGSPAKGVGVTIGANRVVTDAAGRFATRIEPIESVTIEAAGATMTLTLDADCLRRAAVEPWAVENPRAVSTEALLRALPQPITLRLP